MVNNIFKKITFGVVGTVLSFTVIKASPGQAATITYEFSANVQTNYRLDPLLGIPFPLNKGPFMGFFSYEDSLLTGIGEEILGVDEGLVVNAPGRPIGPGGNYPFLTFNNGKLVGLNAAFYIVEPVQSPLQNYEGLGINNKIAYGSFSIQSSRFEEPFVRSYEGNVQYFLRGGGEKPTTVPEPSTVLGTCLFGFASLVTKKKSNKGSDC